MEVKTRYDFRKRVAIITEPREIKVNKRDYEAIQKVTDGQFGYFVITGRIRLSKGRVTYLELRYIKGEPFDLDVRSLHSDLARLDSLQTLDLSMNELKAVPEAVRGAINLRNLVLYDNLIEKIPDWIGELKNLESFYINGNLVPSLPESIGNLTLLKEFYAGDNKIKPLPRSIKRMGSLEYFVIRSNPLNDKAKALIKELKKSGIEII